MNPDFSVKPKLFDSLTLFGQSLTSYLLMYWANIYLARHLAIGEFDDYLVAVSLVTLLSSLATLGLEKYALRVVALNIERQRWGRLRNFLSGSKRIILVFSILLLGTLSIGLEGILAWRGVDFHIAIVVYAGFLPIIALSLFLVEVITVFGYQITAMALYRLFLPITFIALLYAGRYSGLAYTATLAVLCFGTAWCLTLALLIALNRVTHPRPLDVAVSNSQNMRKWLKQAFPLLISSITMTALTSVGTIVLELLYPSGLQVGLFAVCIQTSALIALIGTSTNRYYLPMLVVLIERKDATGTKRLLGNRIRLTSAVIVAYLTIIFTSGQEILKLFGSEFSYGYASLCLCAMGAASNTLFADAPYYLQFMGKNRIVVALLCSATVCVIFLSFVLGARYGVNGVALAYAIPTTTVFALLKLLAHLHMRRYLALNAHR